MTRTNREVYQIFFGVIRLGPPFLVWGIAGHILWAGSANLFLPVRPGHKQARTLQLHSSTQPLALSGCLPQRSFTVATFRALSMLARTLQLHSSI